MKPCSLVQFAARQIFKFLELRVTHSAHCHEDMASTQNHNTAPRGVGLTSNLGKFSLSGLQSFSKGSCGVFLFRPGLVTPKQNTVFPTINLKLKCLSSAQIITPYLLRTFYNVTKLIACSHQTCHLNRANRDYSDAGSLLCVHLISIPVTLR